MVTALVPIADTASLAFETNYIGSRETLAGTDIPPLFLTSASLTVRDVARDVDLSIGARNLFDVRSSDPASEEHPQSRIPTDPRTIWVQLTARIGVRRGAP